MSNWLEVYRAAPSLVTPSREMLTRQVRKALRLVEDLLDVSRHAGEAPTLATAPVDLSQVVKDTVEDIGYEIHKRQQTLTLTLPAETIWVQGDGMRMGQIVANLLENSSKYSGTGAQIVLRLLRDGTRAVLECLRQRAMAQATAANSRSCCPPSRKRIDCREVPYPAHPSRSP